MKGLIRLQVRDADVVVVLTKTIRKVKESGLNICSCHLLIVHDSVLRDESQ